MKGRLHTKKIIAIVLAVFIVSAVTISALADTAANPVNSALDTSNPMYAALKEDRDAIASLEQQNKALRDSIKTASQTNKATEAAIKAGIKNKLAAAKDAIKQADQSIKNELTQLNQQRKDLRRKIAVAIAKKDNTALTTLKAQLIAVDQQIKADLAKIKSNSSAGQTDYKAFLSQSKDNAAKLKAFVEQGKTATADIKEQESKIKTSLSACKVAIKAKDYASADKALKDVITCMQKINVDLNTISGLQQQAASFLNNLASKLA